MVVSSITLLRCSAANPSIAAPVFASEFMVFSLRTDFRVRLLANHWIAYTCALRIRVVTRTFIVCSGKLASNYCMLINVICAPPDAPQIPPAPPQTPLQPTLDRLDRKIVESVREFGLTKLWSVLNAVAKDETTRNRAEARSLRLHLLEKVRRLNRLGLLFLVGRNMLSPVKPDPGLVRRQMSNRIFKTLQFRRAKGCTYA